MAGTKGILAWLSGSSALLADTIHGFSDVFASILVLVGIGLGRTWVVVIEKSWDLLQEQNKFERGVNGNPKKQQK